MSVNAPAHNEFEIVVFGPSWGESILFHYGNNDWAIIDSCIDEETKLPAAINYLNSIGVDHQNAVKQIVISHWHDDHLKGMASIIKECTAAKLNCSSAYFSREFLKLVNLNNQISMLHTDTGLSEFERIMCLLRETNRKLHHAAQDRLLAKEIVATGVNFEFYAVSPSDSSISNFLNWVTTNFPVEKETERKIPAPSGNEAAIVNLVSINDNHILLGADMLEYRDKDRGWNAILKSVAFLHKKVCFLKIPHHGGQSGHNQELWESRIDDDAVCILTPWSRNEGLPSHEDINRICALQDQVYATAKVRLSKKYKRDHAVSKLIRKTASGMRVASTSSGYIRSRRNIDFSTPWEIVLNGEACQLAQARD